MTQPCAVEGCEFPAYAKSVCQRHYQQQRYERRKAGEMATKPCAVKGCPRPMLAKGLCGSHYYTQRVAEQRAAVRAESRPCVVCRADLSGRRPNTVYCSQSCNDADRRRIEMDTRVRRVESCVDCGASLSDKRPHARFCSDKCAQHWRNTRTAVALLESKRSRPPCRGCGEPIPASRRGNAAYCSDECKLRSRRHEAYGLTKAELELLLTQHESCAICHIEEWGIKGPQVDHDHATGKVRGILCLNCNNGLGRFQDNPKLLRAAADYLEGEPAQWPPPPSPS